MNEEETINLKGLLRHYNSEAAEIYRRQQINLNSSVHFSHRVNIEFNSCDVITVASNEGPYIAEFIHHYLYQGFSNIFIGLNNDTSGQTGSIVELITKQYPPGSPDQYRSRASARTAAQFLLQVLRQSIQDQQVLPLHGGGCG